MTIVAAHSEQLQVVLSLGERHGPITDEEFWEICGANPDLKLERTSSGDLVIMAPSGFESGRSNSQVNFQVQLWAKRDGRGTVVDSSAGFTLPNRAVLSPDTAWVLNERLKKLTAEELKRFPPLCPDFAVEVRSESDSLKQQQAKMEEYIDNGCALGVLIDPLKRTVSIYRPGHSPDVLDDPQTVELSPEMPGLQLKMADIWN